MSNADLTRRLTREAWADWSGQSEPESDWASYRAGYVAAARKAEADLDAALAENERLKDDLRVERLTTHTCASVDEDLDAALAENKRLRAGAALVAAATPCACSVQRGRAKRAEAESERLRAEVESLLRECQSPDDNEPLSQDERNAFDYIAGRLDDLLDGGSDDRE